MFKLATLFVTYCCSVLKKLIVWASGIPLKPSRPTHTSTHTHTGQYSRGERTIGTRAIERSARQSRRQQTGRSRRIHLCFLPPLTEENARSVTNERRAGGENTDCAAARGCGRDVHACSDNPGGNPRLRRCKPRRRKNKGGKKNSYPFYIREICFSLYFFPSISALHVYFKGSPR